MGDHLVVVHKVGLSFRVGYVIMLQGMMIDDDDDDDLPVVGGIVQGGGRI
jgi:hypothetical protein